MTNTRTEDNAWKDELEDNKEVECVTDSNWTKGASRGNTVKETPEKYTDTERE